MQFELYRAVMEHTPVKNDANQMIPKHNLIT